jgi:hypothetical protein
MTDEYTLYTLEAFDPKELLLQLLNMSSIKDEPLEIEFNTTHSAFWYVTTKNQNLPRSFTASRRMFHFPKSALENIKDLYGGVPDTTIQLSVSFGEQRYLQEVEFVFELFGLVLTLTQETVVLRRDDDVELIYYNNRCYMGLRTELSQQRIEEIVGRKFEVVELGYGVKGIQNL